MGKKLLIIFVTLASAEFQEVGYLPHGGQHDCRVNIADTDHDSLFEIIFLSDAGSNAKAIYFYEQLAGNPFQFQLEDTIIIEYNEGSLLPWVVADTDTDGLFDMVCLFATGMPPVSGISILESPDSFSCPTQEVWRDTLGQAAIIPVSAFDIDQDGLLEIIKIGTASSVDFVIYESVGDNLYDIVYQDTLGGYSHSRSAFGDFDNDNSIEFLLGGLSWYNNLSIYESPANNTYNFLNLDTLNAPNNKDCFSVADADQDGKFEFVVKGYIANTEFRAFIFEATSDNTYQIIKVFYAPLLGVWDCYSDAGDVDGDGISEIVLAVGESACIIKAVDNDSFYIFETLPGNSNLCVYDLDGDNCGEIIISGLDETRIYKYVPTGIIEEARSKKLEVRLEIYPSPFSKSLDIRWQATPLRGARQGIADSRWQLKIYDATGRLVKSFLLPTFYFLLPTSIVWSGDDNFGHKIPDGIYFIRLEDSESKEIVSKKIIKIE